MALTVIRDYIFCLLFLTREQRLCLLYNIIGKLCYHFISVSSNRIMHHYTSCFCYQPTTDPHKAPISVTRTRTSDYCREIQPRRRFAIQRVEGSGPLHLESRKRRTYRYFPWAQGYRLGPGSRSLFQSLAYRQR